MSLPRPFEGESARARGRECKSPRARVQGSEGEWASDEGERASDEGERARDEGER